MLPYVEQGSLYNQIDFRKGVGLGDNAAVSQTALKVHQCPSDPLQQNFVVYDSNSSTPIATLAHGNYVGCNGWEECFSNAGGNAQGDGSDGLAGALGQAGNGLFYRNSHDRITDVTDGMSDTIFVGERSSNYSPGTWAAAMPGARCPAWMATQPPNPYALPPGAAYDNADFGEALILAHGNATHVPSADFPIYDPDVFYSMRAGQGANFLFGAGSVHFLTRSIDPYTVQHLCTIAGGEVVSDW